MRTAWILLLACLPAVGAAAICESVGEDGEITFTNVPGDSCPQGASLRPSPVKATPHVQPDRAFSNVVGSPADVTNYRDLQFTHPTADGVVRDNSGRLLVTLALQPALRADHFITVTIDGRNHRGAYGSAEIEVSGLEQGTHRISAAVIDSRGRTVFESETQEFTLLRNTRRQILQVSGIAQRADTGSYVVQGTLGGGPMNVGSTVVIRFPDSETEYVGRVGPDRNWTVEVGTEPLKQAEFIVTATTPGQAKFERTQRIHPGLMRPAYVPPGGSSYTPGSSGISSTPGQTNPAFAPRYNP
jgi:hypothetical protein